MDPGSWQIIIFFTTLYITYSIYDTTSILLLRYNVRTIPVQNFTDSNE